MIFVGLDLSLSNSGVAIIRPEGIETYSVKPPKTKHQTVIANEIDRMRYIADHVTLLVPHATEALVIEGPALGARVGKVHERGGLWWLAIDSLYIDGRIFRVPPSSLKKYTTFNGRADKQQMIEAVNRNAGTNIKDDNQADALALAMMGARKLGYPIDPDHGVDVRSLSAMEE